MNADDDDVYHHPVLAVSHGPGPLWLLKHGVENCTSKPVRNVASIFKRLYPGGAHKPKRILLVSAHWETYRIGFEISKSPAPGMLYDYEGFPPGAYKVVYPAKGDSDFANEVSTLLSRSKIKSTQVLRAFDHAAFVPMTLIRRQADIPVVTLSINWKLNARTHFELGRALAPLRDQDTLIICSGQATHGLPGKSDEIPQSGLDFQDWLDLVLTKGDEESDLTYAQRQEKLLAWDSAPGALEAHPRADHFMPFLVAAAAFVLSGVPSTSVSAELVTPQDVNNVVNSPLRELREDVVKVHVKLHEKGPVTPPEEKKVVKKHLHKHKSHSKKVVEEVSEDGEVVRSYDHGSVRIESKEKPKEKHHHHHQKKEIEEKPAKDKTVVEYKHGSVKITGKKAAVTTNDKKEETKEASPNEQDVTATANEANEIVTKLSSTSADKKSILDTYGPVVIICGIIGGVAAIVGVVGLVVTQRQNQKDNMDSVLGDSADLDVDVEVNITAAEGEDVSSDGKDRLDDSDSDANDDSDEEEGTFANGSAHVSV
ncbi:hypothetical protein BBO99_00000888 [Phytophthora kernoviae]|uniref:Extradiol ring-cleavage dioxygenase class III enzyme subunit B domain-containing protein n=2 Tax=Phytophthora kernoviae TaxID=325452 RepID=A0A3R7H9M0_9STRA|nr:hypothetical protein G195_007755 [Phytophthora kernoviae 00238/432]KAG2531638.1 hypothetical protein JM16_000783 [Phytophthora kernoviae]KAG2532995.1 hypothetical protein JM18_000866 [Phytophthora kernoviae]RLN37727.1 hypothetical protein BBI17_000790 [Phytophthora kernoviae]RLN84935.1 hypothetical protein BBO99_00000888 [Phytophthora kernoviae]